MANFSKVTNSMYIVRTQAGFKQAFKDWEGADYSIESFNSCSGYPKAYPSLCVFYTNEIFPSCKAIHLTVITHAIHQSEIENGFIKGERNVQSL
jgi:hypothetical protein